MSVSVKRLEERAFYGCMSLVFIKLSQTLEYIGRVAFNDCGSLTSIFIPPSCQKIVRSDCGHDIDESISI
ncbi:hypothetical protein CTEN210_13644 [Chaetoceros tenuissimus]|uniref:Leucine rich repeat protein n=1 Tax=Chaetoceros tenuissimus TaxID=426638 RepID=A0AAD3HBL8_9STRA|nr:hypothetical protein CTEN210_13644 [Chaetoceros tenuissimus]